MGLLATSSAVEIVAERVLLRTAHDGDRERFIELQAAAHTAGASVIADRATDEHGHVTDAGEELEPSYLVRRSAWGAGLAFEAATAALRAAAGELADQPVIILTPPADARSMRLVARPGFRAVSTFELYGAEQTLAVADLHAFGA